MDDNNIAIDFDKLEWWAKPLVMGALIGHKDRDGFIEELKRYAELAGMQPQELEDKKPLG